MRIVTIIYTVGANQVAKCTQLKLVLLCYLTAILHQVVAGREYLVFSKRTATWWATFIYALG